MLWGRSPCLWAAGYGLRLAAWCGWLDSLRCPGRALWGFHKGGMLWRLRRSLRRKSDRRPRPVGRQPAGRESRNSPTVVAGMPSQSPTPHGHEFRRALRAAVRVSVPVISPVAAPPGEGGGSASDLSLVIGIAGAGAAVVGGGSGCSSAHGATVRSRLRPPVVVLPGTSVHRSAGSTVAVIVVFADKYASPRIRPAASAGGDQGGDFGLCGDPGVGAVAGVAAGGDDFDPEG